MSSNPSQLFLLADHIKLSLLERQRAISLNLSPNSQDGQISRSLETLKSGVDALETQLADTPDTTLHEQLSLLQSQYATLSSQFQTHPSIPATNATTHTPNDPALAPDFAAAATSKPPASTTTTSKPKSVRFRDTSPDPEETATRAALFPYRDDPDASASPDHLDPSRLDNPTLHAHHQHILRAQDDQLDQLGASIARQRELSIRIGDELDAHVALLDDVDEAVDRHRGQLDRARARLDRVGRAARRHWGLSCIVGLIVVLVVLIAITK